MSEDIAKLPGCGWYFVGPSDLAASMGLTPMMDHKSPEHVALVQRVADVAKRNSQHIGIFMSGPDEAPRRWRQGFNLNPTGSEVFLLDTAVNKLLGDLRKVVNS